MKSKMLNLLVSPHRDHTAADTYANLPTQFQFILRLNFERRSSGYTNLRALKSSDTLKNHLNSAQDYLRTLQHTNKIPHHRVEALEHKMNQYQSELNQIVAIDPIANAQALETIQLMNDLSIDDAEPSLQNRLTCSENSTMINIDFRNPNPDVTDPIKKIVITGELTGNLRVEVHVVYDDMSRDNIAEKLRESAPDHVEYFNVIGDGLIYLSSTNIKLVLFFIRELVDIRPFLSGIYSALTHNGFGFNPEISHALYTSDAPIIRTSQALTVRPQAPGSYHRETRYRERVLVCDTDVDWAYSGELAYEIGRRDANYHLYRRINQNRSHTNAILPLTSSPASLDGILHASHTSVVLRPSLPPISIMPDAGANAKALENIDVDIPEHLTCALSLQIMTDPVCFEGLPSGNKKAFEYDWIMDYLSRTKKHPITREDVDEKMLVSIWALKKECDTFTREQVKVASTMKKFK